MTADASPLLVASDLAIDYTTPKGMVRSLDGADLIVERGSITALVGESGSGKTTLGLAAGRLLASNARYSQGQLCFEGISVLDCDDDELRRIRRQQLGFVFQNPAAALDPTMRVRRQMELVTSLDASGAELESALEAVSLSEIPRVLRAYPHELSGGMAQRVGIAMALMRSPRLLVADEPTAAVDATQRPQILDLLVSRCRDAGCALLLLTHDLHAVARHCSHIAVMYGGRVVESGPTSNVLGDPLHPYTRALLSALPGEEQPGQRLDAIAGAPPVLMGPASGCSFAARCPSAVERCQVERPHYDIVNDCTLCCHLVSSGTITATREGAPSSLRLARSLLPPVATERRNDE